MGNVGWFCVSAIGVVVLGYLFLVFVLGPTGNRKQAEKRKRILEQGQLVKCWIVMADDQLWRGLSPGDMHSCHVVFTTTPNVSDLEARLEELSDRLRAFDPGEDPTEAEIITANVMKTELGYFIPLRLPERVSGDLEAYNVSVMLGYEMLPGGKLSGSTISCKVLLDGDDAGAALAETPSNA